MIIRQIRCFRGPNIWAPCPVLEATLDLSRGWPWPEDKARRVAGRLLPFAPPGPLAPFHAFARSALALQAAAGYRVAFHAAREAGPPGVALAAFEFVEEPAGRAAAEAALRLLQAAEGDGPIPLEEEQAALRRVEYDLRLPASTAAVYNAARARGIPAARLSPEYSRFLRLGQGARQHRCHASEPNSVGAVARLASTDKHLAKELLRGAGVPVPEGRLVNSAEAAWAAARELGLPVATKPQDTDLATGVSLDLRTREQVEAGFRSANEHSRWVLVERFAPGLEHRVFVVDDRVVAVTQIAPPHVVGDGASTVAELVARVNLDPRRGEEGGRTPLFRMKLDAEAEAVLAAQGYTTSSVPPAGARVLVRRNPPYIASGGSLVDLTDRIHPRNAAHAVAAARALQIRVAGLDVVALDIGAPLEEQAGVVVEINAGPGLWLHLAPWADSPRPVGEAIVATMFPPGQDGRIPVVAVVGTSPGPAVAHLAALLDLAGRRPGRVGPAEVSVGGRTWPAAGGPQERAAVLFQYPAVDVALIETRTEELLEAGFANDRCDVAVVLDAQPAGPNDYSPVLRHMLGENGVWVQPAGVAAPPGARCVRFGGDGAEAGTREYLAQGGKAVLVRGGCIVLSDGGSVASLGNLAEGRKGGEALLAALAGAAALGLDAEALAAYVRSLA